MKNREHRARVAQDTLETIEKGHYLNDKNQVISVAESLRAAIDCSIHYTAQQLHEMMSEPSPSSSHQLATRIEVRNESTLAAGKRLVEQGHDDVLCLNFASARNPGGGFLGGSEAQEENLAKSSGLYPCIAQKTEMYEANRRMRFCAYNDDMIYSPGVPVFRDEHYHFLDQPHTLSFVTAPAVNHGAVARSEPERLPELEWIMLQRIAMLLALARHHGHKTLVLGAWGCGVFQNKPMDMARWFHRHLVKNAGYRNAFETVVFAVLDTRNDGTFAAFAETFGESTV